MPKTTRNKVHRVGDWIIAPQPHWRTNMTTLGLETGSGKQGGTSCWWDWGIWFEEKGVGSPFKSFRTIKEAKAYLAERAAKKAEKIIAD